MKANSANSKEYDEFVDKFKPRKTTDDCHTPPLVYDAVRDWACAEYGIDPESIVRPFYPGGDYEHFTYPDGCVVLDNPPFSILSQICEFYLNRNIPFFLFAPSLTAFSSRNAVMRTNHIICGADIIYDNGAVVHTSFVTSFGGDIIAQTAPELHKKIEDAVAKTKAEATKSLPKYDYPDNIVTSAMMGRYCKYGIDLKIKKSECVSVSKMDAQREKKKDIFGGGLLLSSSAAERKALAERAYIKRAAEREKTEREKIVWELSEREKKIVEDLDLTAKPKIVVEETLAKKNKNGEWYVEMLDFGNLV